MVEELEQAEKEARRARFKTRMLWVLIVLDALLFVYAVVEIVLLTISMLK